MINNSWLDNWGSGLLLTILNLCGGISKHGTMASLLSDACFIANIFINNYCATEILAPRFSLSSTCSSSSGTCC